MRQKGLSYHFAFSLLLCFCSFLICFFTILFISIWASDFDFPTPPCFYSSTLFIHERILRFRLFSAFGSDAIFESSGLLFFLRIFYDVGASGSFLLIFLSYCPIEAVDNYAKAKLFDNDFFSLFLTSFLSSLTFS